MSVLVDTCVWSLALRRKKVKPNDPHIAELAKLIQDGNVRIIGPIRQEILSGVSSETQFEQLREYLAAFPDLPLDTQIFEMAAQYFNINRSKGIQGSNTDFLICATATFYDLSIYTIDKDFFNFQSYSNLIFHIPV